MTISRVDPASDRITPGAGASDAIGTAPTATDSLARLEGTGRRSPARWTVAPWLGLAIGCLCAMARADAAPTFQYVTLDSSYVAYERAVGDVDGDGDNDVVAVREGDTNLQVFRAPAWDRSTLVSFSGTNRYPRADDLRLADLDNDGDLDIVTRLGPTAGSDAAGIAVWCENSGGGVFVQHPIGTSLEYVKDFAVADFDRDGRKDVAMRMDSRTQVWLQTAPDMWTEVVLNHAAHEGLAVGDVDMDGDPDLVLNGFWFSTPDTAAAVRVAANWVSHTVDPAWFGQGGDWTADSCKVAVGDFDGDGVNDIVFSHSERPGYAVAWYRSSTAGGAGPWIKQSVGVVDYCHTLQVADWDGDGEADLLAGGMIQSQHRGLRLFLNGGAGTTWTQQVIQSDGSYSTQIGDIDNDGDPDIVGIRNWDAAPTYIYRNTSPVPIDTVPPAISVVTAVSTNRVQVVFSEPVNVIAAETVANYSINHGVTISSAVLGADTRTVTLATTTLAAGGATALDAWLYRQVSGSHARTFGLCFPDIDGDGDLDIASGPFVYRNPGGSLTAAWSQQTIPNAVHAFVSVDVDGDQLADLLAQKDNPGAGWVDLTWSEATDASGTSWSTPVAIGNVPRGSEPEGIQGYAVAQLVAGGRPEVIVNSPQGVYFFSIPASSPAAGNWPRVFIAANDSEEGVGVADIDADGDLDVSFTSGVARQVKWARNPGNGTGNWPVFVIGTFPEADWPDRCLAADLNGDGRIDIVATEENIGTAADALACWWEQPASGPTSADWVRRTITTQYTMNSLDVGDVDRDGDVDLVMAEHRGTRRIAVWANDGAGVFAERRVGEGHESHLGGRLADLDRDGDLDLVSIAYDASNELHLWRNDNPAPAGEYTLTVNNVTDSANPPNTIIANSQAAFSYSPGQITITANPASVTAGEGAQVQFSVAATGPAPLTYQWQRQEPGGSFADVPEISPYSGATGAVLTVSGAVSAMSGDQFRCVVGHAGGTSVTSAAAMLTVVAAPEIDSPPVATIGIAGGTITLSVAATGPGPLAYQWRLDGVAISGATSAQYTIPSAQAFHAGLYSVVVTGYSVSVTSADAAVTVNPAPASSACVMNLSARGPLESASDVLIPGFVIEGAGTKRLLIRAVGPTLAAFGVTGPLVDPQISLKRFDTAMDGYVDLLSNDDWGAQANATQVASLASALGAFPLPADSADSALIADLAPGRYTVLASGRNGGTGIALVELYDADAAGPTARLVNISNRGFVGTGGEIMIPGFVVSAEGSRTVLVRAVGPGLAAFGLSEFLADPQFTVFTGGAPILSNNDWDGIPGATTTASVAAQVGAFALDRASKDAALVCTLPPGAYTVQASGVGSTTGVALVEIYLVP